MMNDSLAIDPARLTTFHVVRANDPAELDGRSRVSDRLPEPSRIYKYRLRDRALWRMRFDRPIFSLATRSEGAVLASFADSSFATEVSIDGNEGDLFCFTTLLNGGLTLIQDGEPTTGTVARGLAFRPGPETRLLTSDDSARANVFIKVAEVEDALEHMLDDCLRRPLEFRPALDWSSGLAASLKYQLDFVMHEFQRPDGVASNAVALASMTDLLVTLVLRAAPHNYADELEMGPAGAVPAYVRRAEEFMRANGTKAIRMADVAAAAGCSVRTLGAAFRQFRGTTPLAALHAIRLEQAHGELSLGATGTSIATIARRHGFTNPARFTAAFRRRFGETPSEVLRRGARS